MSSEDQTRWTPLAKLARQFNSNLAALRQRDVDLAEQLAGCVPDCEYFISPRADRIELAKRVAGGGEIQPISNPLPPARAREIATQLYPNGQYNQPLLIAGLDQGWLWDAIFKLKCFCAMAPGLRMPLYLLASQIERLWVVMHYQNWTELLSDRRVYIAVGATSAVTLESILGENPPLSVPKLAVTVEQRLWAPGENLEAMIARLNAAEALVLAELQSQMAGEQWTQLPARPLRVLGITSRYTSFLQHSMRDWLAAFEKLGHQTRLLIEGNDHEILPAPVYARECKTYRPDLILVIDHCRGELSGLPTHVPCVMWIQDRMPHIYRAEAGTMQGAADYVIGYGRQECSRKWGYPAARFMPAMVGVNEDRFAPRRLDAGELAHYGCDVSFVSHASASAEQIIQEQIKQSTSPNARKLLDGIYQRLRHVYDGGGSVTLVPALQAIIQSALDEHHLRADLGPLTDMVSHRLNNAMLRHQAIRWVVATGADLRLYGRGWEAHPEFKAFARGVADNQNQLAIIYQASRINLQVTPFGAAHQRLFEGLAAGGFFLLRSVSGDAFDVVNLQLWEWCRKAGVQDGRGMLERGRGDAAFEQMAAQIELLTEAHPLADPDWFYAGLEEAAMGGFSRSAGTLWPEYDDVSFWTQQQLAEKVERFLADLDQRAATAASMRQAVLQWHTYGAISRRMLAFIAADLAGKKRARAA